METSVAFNLQHCQSLASKDQMIFMTNTLLWRLVPKKDFAEGYRSYGQNCVSLFLNLRNALCNDILIGALEISFTAHIGFAN